MESEPRNNPESGIRSPTRFEFLRRWGEYDPRAVALLATLNGMGVAGFISAAQDFAHGNIGHGILKTAFTLWFPVSLSGGTGIAMLECAQEAEFNSPDKNKAIHR